MGIKILRFAGAAAIIVGWISLTLLFVLVGLLMSLDEEWRGWGDFLLNPYIVGPYASITVVLAIVFRHIAKRTPASQATSLDRPPPPMV